MHEEQKSITSGQKQPVLAPVQARGFLTHLQMDLMDLRNLPYIYMFMSSQTQLDSPHDWSFHKIFMDLSIEK